MTSRTATPSSVPFPAADLRFDAVEIAAGTYWVGKREPGSIFHANPYLRCFQGVDEKTGRKNEFNLLVDPGSSSDFSTVHTKVASRIGGLERLSALFINHQDPDVGASASIISARYAPKAAIICSEDTWRLIVHQNLPRARFVPTEKYAQGIRLPTGHVVLPVPSPFCHFRGAVMLYDPETRVLFTGDLFGGLTEANATSLYADESDWAGIRAFHQIYMPVNQALKKAVETIRALSPAVEIIAPQHGRLITGSLIESFCDKMSRLQVGLDLMDEENDPSTLQAWNVVAQRVIQIARSYLGPLADSKLTSSSELLDTSTFEGQRLVIRSMGKWTVEHLVELLCAQEPPEVSGPIYVEASTAAAEYNLPTPHLQLEGSEDADGDAWQSAPSRP